MVSASIYFIAVENHHNKWIILSYIKHSLL